MNAPFRIASPEGDQELEKKFVEEAAAKDMIQLKGHRSVLSLFVCSVLLLVRLLARIWKVAVQNML